MVSFVDVALTWFHRSASLLQNSSHSLVFLDLPSRGGVIPASKPLHESRFHQLLDKISGWVDAVALDLQRSLRDDPEVIAARLPAPWEVLHGEGDHLDMLYKRIVFVKL